MKIVKKKSPNNHLNVYLANPDFHFNDSTSFPINGVLQFSEEELTDLSIFVRIFIKFWKGREIGESIQAVSEQKEIKKEKLWPEKKNSQEGNKSSLVQILREKIADKKEKLQEFAISIPNSFQPSILVETEESNLHFPIGLTYEMQFYIASSEDDTPRNTSIVRLYIRNKEFLPDSLRNIARPPVRVTKGFNLQSGLIKLQVYLRKDIYEPGETMSVEVNVSNDSKKTIKSVRCEVFQFLYIHKLKSHFDINVLRLESLEHCPIVPQTKFRDTYDLILSTDFKRRKGLALEGSNKDKDVALASTTLQDINSSTVEDPNPGIKVLYSLKVSLLCGKIGGDFHVEVPFFLLRSTPEFELNKECSEDIEIEDFSKLRREKSLDNI